jgi:hypothetical protein
MDRCRCAGALDEQAHNAVCYPQEAGEPTTHTNEATAEVRRHSPWTRTTNRQDFLDTVIGPFNARMKTPLVPTVRGIYADGDMVIILFDAAATTKDDQLPQHLHVVFPDEGGKGDRRHRLLRHARVR